MPQITPVLPVVFQTCGEKKRCAQKCSGFFFQKAPPSAVDPECPAKSQCFTTRWDKTECYNRGATYLELLVRCLEKVQKYSSKWWFNGGKNPGRIRKKVTNKTNPRILHWDILGTITKGLSLLIKPIVPSMIQSTIGCALNRVPMVLIVFSLRILGVITHMYVRSL